jgi:phosphonate transport system permease protein
MTATHAPPTAPRPAPPTGVKRRRALLALLLIVGAVWSLTGIDITLDRVLGAPGDAWNIFKRLWPPAMGEALDRGVVGKVFESVYIAWIGTIIGAVLSLPLAFLAATNVAPRWIRIPVRQLFNAIRAVPELIVAVIFIPITGLGPWAGTLAIGLHSVGTLGKWATETIEGIDTGPLEAVEATGGRWVSGMRWGVLPQIMPIVASFWLFRFEINVRASAVLGMIGAGGVGAELVSQLRFRNFTAVGAVLGITVLVVLTIDSLSAAVRRRIIAGATRTSGPDVDGDRNAEALADLTGFRR